MNISQIYLINLNDGHDIILFQFPKLSFGHVHMNFDLLMSISIGIHFNLSIDYGFPLQHCPCQPTVGSKETLFFFRTNVTAKLVRFCAMLSRLGKLLDIASLVHQQLGLVDPTQSQVSYYVINETSVCLKMLCYTTCVPTDLLYSGRNLTGKHRFFKSLLITSNSCCNIKWVNSTIVSNTGNSCYR